MQRFSRKGRGGKRGKNGTEEEDFGDFHVYGSFIFGYGIASLRC